ncbi:MAG: ABC transporter permease [Candidatus Schekmanbacteria bacterium]|nr:ABC transporter permease [Candidatus Schekmanbacteria bacterium]
MTGRDALAFALGAVAFHRARSLLTASGIAVGIAAVMLLTSIGEGIHRFVLTEFTQFGTHLVIVAPGRTSTVGSPGGVVGTVRPLSLEDALSMQRLPNLRAVMPVVQGNALIEAGDRSRRSMVNGVGPPMPEVWQFRLAQGSFLPADDPRAPRSLAVLGSRLCTELFPAASPLGQRIEIGGYRYTVIGVMASKGQFLGFDLDDAVYVPTSKALEMFHRDGVMEIDVLYAASASVSAVVDKVRAHLTARHRSEDFTIITQKQMLDVLGSILDILTFAVGALGGISLLVGGVGILTIMTIAISERRSEIGLLLALGARRPQILGLFLFEAAMLSALGGLAGLGAGVAIGELLKVIVPVLPVHASWQYAAIAEGIAVTVGLVAGVAPAQKASRLDPVASLRAE